MGPHLPNPRPRRLGALLNSNGQCRCALRSGLVWEWINHAIGALAMLKCLGLQLVKAVRKVTYTIVLRLVTQTRVSEFAVVDLTLDQRGTRLFPDVANAVALIKEFDSRRFGMLRRQIKRIAIADIPGSAGEYWSEIDAAVIAPDHLAGQVPLAVAMTLIHEATHARLQRAGVVRPGREERVERCCVAREIAFARRVPGSEQLIAGAHQKLGSRWWQGTAGHRRYSQRLQAIGAPKWLRRMLLWIRS